MKNSNKPEEVKTENNENIQKIDSENSAEGAERKTAETTAAKRKISSKQIILFVTMAVLVAAIVTSVVVFARLGADNKESASVSESVSETESSGESLSESLSESEGESRNPYENVDIDPSKLEFGVDKNGNVTIKGRDKLMLGNLVIPDKTPDGKEITSISDRAFGTCRNLISVVIPSGVTVIGEYAFQLCSELKSVTIGSGVIEIKQNAFYKTAITEIVIPDSVEIIGKRAFYDCEKLASVTIGKGVKSIGDRAFADCNLLETIRYNGTVEEWKAIEKHSNWKGLYSNDFVVECLDGKLTKDEA